MTIEKDSTTKPLTTRDDVTVHFADAARREQATGFQRHDYQTGEIIAEEAFRLPETTLSTRILYVMLPSGLEGLIRTMPGSFGDGFHAV